LWEFQVDKSARRSQTKLVSEWILHGVIALIPSAEFELIRTLKHIAEAEWNAGQVSGCLRGTRERVLDTIIKWKKATSSPPILWLNGDSGTGKSAIMHSACQLFHANGELGASFFFSQDRETRNKIDFVFPTLAYRLSFFNPGLRARIAEALEDRSLLQSNLLERQLRELIVEPIRAVYGNSSISILIAIDALDECGGAREASRGSRPQTSIAYILSLLISELGTVAKSLKILVASRPADELTGFFSRADTKAVSSILYLRDVDQAILEKDIRFFISRRLQELSEEHDYGTWPSEDDITRILELSGQLFLAAATILRILEFTDGKGARDPKQALESLRKSEPGSLGLDGLYCEVIRLVAHCHKGQNARNKIRRFLTFVVLSFDTLTAAHIDEFLDIDSRSLHSVLRSVIAIPEDGSTVHAIHASFRDFITHPERCVDTDIRYIDPLQGNILIAKRCLEQLQPLKRDLLDVGKDLRHQYRMVNNTDVKDRILQHPLLTPPFRYSIKYWIKHVMCCITAGAIEDSELLEMVTSFVEGRLINWIEALSYLKLLDDGLQSLDKIVAALLVRFFEAATCVVLIILSSNLQFANYSMILVD
jgi:hypothetical protein